VNDDITRRNFLARSSHVAIGSTLALHLSALTALTGCAGMYKHLTAAEARTLEALAAQILPSDDGTPGAIEAGVVPFIDRALGHAFFRESAPVLRAGLSALDARARDRGTRRGFAALDPESQRSEILEIEQTPFFALARSLTVMGALSDPIHGGNRDGAGWSMLGIEHKPIYTAPFGWYDAQ
jgi:hypothetical protein